MNTEDDPIETMEDIAGLTCYTPEHDRIMQVRLEVVKNVYYGLDFTPSYHGSGSVEVKKGLYKDFGIWNDKDRRSGNNDFPFSVAVPKKIALKGYTEPDLTDGGYQHPLANSFVFDLANQVGRKHETFTSCWDSPRNGDNLRFGFKNQQDGEKFIELIKDYQLENKGWGKAF